MSERLRNLATIVVVVVALGVIVGGLWPRGTPSADPAARAYSLEVRLKCPICAGESLASSQTGLARDLRAYIEERIAAGASDEEILADFVARYGEQVVLDPPGTGWGAALWLVPGLVAIVGVAVVLGRRRRGSPRRRAVPPAPRAPEDAIP